MEQKTILMPLPRYGFDPTETAVPWKILTERGHDVRFATPDGKPGAADERMLRGKDLGILKGVLAASNDAVACYEAMAMSERFLHPMTYGAMQEQDFDAIMLPGGHDKGVREYLESKDVQRVVVDCFRAQKIVAAICHGVLAAARSIDPETKVSVLAKRKTTALLGSQEWISYQLTRAWLGQYYHTYPSTTVEEEVRTALADQKQFIAGPLPLARDTREHPERGFCVQDGEYLSARWPGDAYRFSFELARMLEAS